MGLQAFGFHASGKGTHSVTVGGLYRQTPVSGIFGRDLAASALGLPVA